MGIVKTVKELLTGKPTKRKPKKPTVAKVAAKAETSLKKVSGVAKKTSARVKLKPAAKASRTVKRKK